MILTFSFLLSSTIFMYTCINMIVKYFINISEHFHIAIIMKYMLNLSFLALLEYAIELMFFSFFSFVDKMELLEIAKTSAAKSLGIVYLDLTS